MIPSAGSAQVYHHHWLAYCKPLSFASLLLVLGGGLARLWLPLGLVALAMALIVALGTYLYRSWHTLAFTDDNRLVYRHGFLGCTENVFYLFGVITPHRTPILGQWLDVGEVHLSIPNVRIRHIAHFSAFRSRLMSSAQRQESPPSPPVQVIIQLPPRQPAGRWPDLAPPAGPGPVLLYPDGTQRRREQPRHTR